MAFNFPDTPFVGQVVNNGAASYRWDGVKWVNAGGIGAGGDATVTSITIDPGVLAASPGYTSRIGLNAYLDAAGQWRYVANGAAGAIVTSTVGPTGVIDTASRIVFLLADRNTAGPDAPVPDMRGLINMFYGPQGQGSGNDFVVIGGATNTVFPANNPSGDSLFCSQLGVELGAVVNAPQFAAYSRIMMNMYADINGQTRYIDNGPGGGICVSNTHQGAPADISRMVFFMDAPNAAGQGAPAAFHGAINIVSGPPGQPIAPFVVIGADSDNELPVTHFPRRGSLLANDIFIRADPVSTDRASRMGFNMMQDGGTPVNWWYMSDGPAAQWATHEINVNPDGTPGAVGASNVLFTVYPAGARETSPLTPGIGKFENIGLQIFGDAGTPSNFTSIAVSANTPESGNVPSLRHVQVGPANSGGAGFRQLVVPN